MKPKEAASRIIQCGRHRGTGSWSEISNECNQHCNTCMEPESILMQVRNSKIIIILNVYFSYNQKETSCS